MSERMEFRVQLVPVDDGPMSKVQVFFTSDESMSGLSDGYSLLAEEDSYDEAVQAAADEIAYQVNARLKVDAEVDAE